MKMNKVLKGTLAVAAVAATWAGVSATDASAADPTISNATAAKVSAVKLDTKTQTLTVTGSGKEVLFAVGTVKKGTCTVKAWDVYDITAGAVSIDLSKLSNVKDNYLVVEGNDATEPIIIKIPAADKAAAAVFAADKAEVTFGTGANAKVAKATEGKKTKYEYRTAYGAWTTVDESNASNKQDWTKYQQQGATLYFRTPGLESTDVAMTWDASKEKLKFNGSETEYAVQVTTATLPGKEAKLSIAKRANGPAVAVDYAKGTVTLPKNSEYRVVSAATLMASVTVTENTAKAVKAVTDLFPSTDSSASGAVEVRTKAVEKKKAASKWTRVEVQKPAAFASGFLTAGNTVDTSGTGAGTEAEPKVYGGKGVKDALLKEASTDTTSVLAIEYTKVSKKDAIKIKNNGKLDYEIVVQAYATSPTAPAADAKATKIASGKEVTLKVANAADGQQIWIRVAGNKKTATWVGAYSVLGRIDYPGKATALN